MLNLARCHRKSKAGVSVASLKKNNMLQFFFLKKDYQTEHFLQLSYSLAAALSTGYFSSE